jgi:hypothetical protein
MYIVLDMYVYLMPLTRRVDHAVQYAYTVDISRLRRSYFLQNDSPRYTDSPLIDYLSSATLLLINACIHHVCIIPAV